VFDTLEPKAAVVKTAKGNWYNMHIQPYRPVDSVIEGAVITFVDVTEIQKLQAALGEKEEKS